MDHRKKTELRVTALKYFIGFSLFALFLGDCAYTYFLYKPCLILSLAIGILMLAKAFFLDRDIYRNKCFPFLFLFVISYIVTICLNYQHSFFNNCGQLMYTCLYFFLFFCQFSLLEGEDRKQILQFVLCMIFAVALVFAVLSICMVLFRYSGQISIRGITTDVGISSRAGRFQLVGIAAGGSTLGTICILGLFSGLALTALKGKRASSLLIVVSVIFILTFCLTNVFATLVMMLAFSFWWTLCHGLAGFTVCSSVERRKRLFFTITRVVVSCSMVFVLYFGIQTAEGWAINHYNDAVDYMKNELFAPAVPETPSTPEAPSTPGTPSTPPTSEVPEKPQTPGPPTSEEISITRDLGSSLGSGRFEIWKAALKEFPRHPLGVTTSNIHVTLPSGSVFENLHNGFLNLLIGAGIVGSALIMVFGLLLLYRAMRYLLTHPLNQETRYLALIISVCVAILGGDLVNGGFVLWRGGRYIILWLLLGEIYAVAVNGGDDKGMEDQNHEHTSTAEAALRESN